MIFRWLVAVLLLQSSCALAASYSFLGYTMPQAGLNEALFLAMVVVGALIHYAHEQATGKTGSANFLAYWMKDSPGSSVATLMTLMVWMGTVLQSGIVDTMAPWAVFLFALQSGYMTNSLVNQGAPPPAAPISTT